MLIEGEWLLQVMSGSETHYHPAGSLVGFLNYIFEPSFYVKYV